MSVSPFTIEDVADLLSIQKLGSGSDRGNFPVVCPYCHDQRGKMNFCISKDGEVKNTYNCYHCGSRGNMLQLYADMKGFTGQDRCKKAYWEIYYTLNSGMSRVSYSYERNQSKIRELTKPAASAADDTQKDEVYRAMLTYLKLKEQHRADLYRRGLTEPMIDHMERMGYKSTDDSEAKRIARCLIRDGYRLNGVPGFFVDKNGDWDVAFYRYNRGYLCPVYNIDKQIVGFQIRLDKPFKGMKYSWFTSSGKEKGCSSKSPAGYYGCIPDKVVYVTEGILKAAVAYEATGRSFIGNPGVAHYKELEVMLKELKEQGLRTVMECYDMDKLMRIDCNRDYKDTCRQCRGEIDSVCPRKKQKRDDIRNGCRHLYRICGELNLRCIRMVWDVDKAEHWNGVLKGIDDWLVEKRKSKIEKIESMKKFL